MACTESDYAYLREVVLQQSSNLIDPSRNMLFDTRLTSVARQAGASNLKQLVDILRSRQPTQLHRAVAEAMTVNETSFFRDIKPFDLLHRSIIPSLIERRAAERHLRIWSAASSTGQEAFSIAMLLKDKFPELSGWDIQIVGTDISRQVVEYAQRGRYRRLEVNRGLPAAMLLRFMTRDEEEWEVSELLRSMCSFYCANLCEPLAVLPQFDIVLLRNVLLYFSPQDRSNVFRAVRSHMAHDSYLLLGNAEQAEESTSLFRVEFSDEANSYYYRPA
jgi:chemotaxis protein methyltransferase CheR